MGSNWDKASHADIGRFHFFPASPLHNLSRSFFRSLSLASLRLHIVAEWMNHQVCIHILLDGIYSSAELWVPLLGRVGEREILQISLASFGATNVLHIVAEQMNYQICIHILLVCYLQLC